MNTATLPDGTTIMTNETAPTTEQLWANVRGGRDQLLEKYVDWYQSKPLVYDALASIQRSQLAAYRQALLDFPADLLSHLGSTPPTGYRIYYPVQPNFFEDHPLGRIHTADTQTVI
jgi:hypothetical protein